MAPKNNDRDQLFILLATAYTGFEPPRRLPASRASLTLTVILGTTRD